MVKFLHTKQYRLLGRKLLIRKNPLSVKRAQALQLGNNVLFRRRGCYLDVLNLGRRGATCAAASE